MNFSEKFKDFCKELEKQLEEPKRDSDKNVKQPLPTMDEPKFNIHVRRSFDDTIEIPVSEMNLDTQFKIHKRSLPTGIDRPIMWGLTEAEARTILAKFLKSKRVSSEDGEICIIYYDMVRDDGVRYSVYDNPPGFIQENGRMSPFKGGLDKGENMKLECNFCRSKIFKKTDNLWLVQVGNKDYLLCKFHKNRQELKQRYKDDYNKNQRQEKVL